jgi:predicted transcriptional regulator
MKNSEALVIATNYDTILEMAGMDFGYSLELLEESKKVEPVQLKLESMQTLLTKKRKGLDEKLEKIKDDVSKTEEVKKIESEIEKEVSSAQKSWDLLLDEEFTGTFTPIDLSKVPTDTEKLDKKVDEKGNSLVRLSLLFLSRKNLVKK